MGYDAPSRKDMIVMDLLDDIFAQLRHGGEMAVLHSLEAMGKCEQPPGEKPFGQLVPRSVVHQDTVRYVINDVLEFTQIGRPAILDPRCVPEHEISESEFIPDVVCKLHHQGLGIFPEKTGAEASGNARHAFL